jgi:hypothetical protein
MRCDETRITIGWLFADFGSMERMAIVRVVPVNCAPSIGCLGVGSYRLPLAFQTHDRRFLPMTFWSKRAVEVLNAAGWPVDESGAVIGQSEFLENS